MDSKVLCFSFDDYFLFSTLQVGCKIELFHKMWQLKLRDSGNDGDNHLWPLFLVQWRVHPWGKHCRQWRLEAGLLCLSEWRSQVPWEGAQTAWTWSVPSATLLCGLCSGKKWTQRDWGPSSVVRASELKSEDPGFDPLAGQGESQLLCRLVCAWPPFVCMAHSPICAYVKDPITICHKRVRFHCWRYGNTTTVLARGRNKKAE